ncbi:DUF6233 domain-containing protein [Streptomyces sp. NPDC007251]|uniref:DUF6233 domain-containing protein n=1 Tax=unclassified Streptomyces TaxID=2593676 RepID=UPI0033EBA2DE
MSCRRTSSGCATCGCGTRCGWPASTARSNCFSRRQAEQDHGRRSRPEPPKWVVEPGISVGRPPVQVHRGTCYMAGKRHRPAEQDEARRLLADGTSACTHCRPDASLGIID